MAAVLPTSARHGRLPAVAVVAVVAYSAVASLLDPFTRPIQVATVLPCIGLLVLAVARGWHRRGRSAGTPVRRRELPLWGPALVVWLVLVLLAVAVQLFNYFEWPRELYPTLSSLASRVFGVRVVRAAGFALWLWFGWYLVDR
jgi:hypothetical protein